MMKKVAGFMVALLLGGCVANPSVPDKGTPAQVALYRSHCLKPQLDPSGYLLYGYGSGKTVREARLQAYQDLAEQLKVQVSTQATGTTRKKGNAVSRTYQSKVETSSRIEFEQLELDCLDNSDPSGQVHLGLKFDNRPLAQILADRLAQQPELKLTRPRWQGPYPLTNSRLLGEVGKLLQKAWGTGVVNRDVPVMLFDRKGVWYLQVGEVRQPVDIDTLLPQLDWRYNARGLQVQLLNVRGEPIRPPLVQYQNFRLRIRAPAPGYVSLLMIDEKGKVLLAEDGLAIRKQLLLPKGDVYEAVLAEANRPARDTLLVVYSKQPLAWAQFNRLQTDRSYQQLKAVENLDELFDWLAQGNRSGFATNGFSMLIVP